MAWVNFNIFLIIIIGFWIYPIVINILPFSNLNKKLKITSIILTLIGIIALIVFIVILWRNLDRPPLRTLGETRLWYSLFLPIIGLIIYLRWNYKWMISYSLSLASLFLIINFMHPEVFDKTLMPALQSPWFIPHVIVYIFAYALLAVSSLVGFRGLIKYYKVINVLGLNNLEEKIHPPKNIIQNSFDKSLLLLADNMVYIGFAFLTLGLLFGALWAKEAWGHYWTWDPKETWAFLTWIGYLIYMHYRYYHPKKIKHPLIILTVSFLILLIAWFGINYLASGANSVHTYSQ